jgi:hypothetical protein
VGILWILRIAKKENLLIPLAAAFVIVAMVNLAVIRLQGIAV